MTEATLKGVMHSEFRVFQRLMSSFPSRKDIESITKNAIINTNVKAELDLLRLENRQQQNAMRQMMIMVATIDNKIAAVSREMKTIRDSTELLARLAIS